MSTRTALKGEILDDIERDDATDGARVLSAISSAIKFYQPRRFFFNESRDVTFATVADQWVYPFGTGASEIDELYTIDLALVEDASNDYWLSRRDYREIEYLNDNTATSNRPDTYGYIGKSLVLYPIPDAAYTVRLTGHVKLAEPATDDEADNAWMTEAYELIRCRAKAYLGAHVYRDTELAQVMKVAEQEALRSLMDASTTKEAAGYIIPSDF